MQTTILNITNFAKKHQFEILALRITQIVYTLFGFLAAIIIGYSSNFEYPAAIFMTLLLGTTAMIFVGFELLIKGVKRNKTWAHNISLMLFLLCILSPLLPISILGILGRKN